MITIEEALRWGAVTLKKTSDTPRLDSDLLMMNILSLSRESLILKSQENLTDEQLHKFQSNIEKASNNVPIPYITNSREFFGLDFFVTESVLIPRPETEILVEVALENIAVIVEKNIKEISILDLGTGSGCIIISVIKEALIKFPGIKFSGSAVDLSPQALEVAKFNAEKFLVSDYITFYEGSWLEPVMGKKFNIILSNPPYIAKEDPDIHISTKLEPQEALFSEDLSQIGDGLRCIGDIIKNCKSCLLHDGILALECGWKQGEWVVKIFKDIEFTDVFIKKDLQGYNRVIIGKI